MGSRDVDQGSLCWLSVDAVDFHDLKSVILNVKVLADKSSLVDNPEQVRSIRLDRQAGVHCIVHQERVWDRLRASGVVERQEALGQILYHVVVPVG